MVREDEFVGQAMEAAKEILKPPLLVERGANLLYQITINNRLEVDSTVNLKKPSRGQSAFQTDLCVFEKVSPDVKIPRVVIEFKHGITTHDVLTYSAKARKHKQVYPYLRYGIMVANERAIPGRVFTHNEALDFCVAAASYKETRLHELLGRILPEEVETSRRLESIFFGKAPVHIFRNEIVLEAGDGRGG